MLKNASQPHCHARISGYFVLSVFVINLTAVAQDAAEGTEPIQETLNAKDKTPVDGRIPVQSDLTEADQKIYDVLDHETFFEFPGNPIEDVFGYLSDAHVIPILIDEAAIADI